MVGRSGAQAITEEIRRASDIVDVVSSYVTLRRSGSGLKGLCPFHGEKTASFHVSPEKQVFKCFGCGVGGDVFKFIQQRESMSFPEARAMLAARAGISLEAESRTAPSGDGPGKVEIERVNRWAMNWFARQLKHADGGAARRYLSGRGISDDSASEYELGLAPDRWDGLRSAAQRSGLDEAHLLAAGLLRQNEDGRRYDAFRGRAIFPIVDSMKRVVGFGGRTLKDDEPAKYVNSPQSVLFDKSRALYGLAQAKDAFRESRCAIVVEGYVDCILCQQFGFRHTVATLGTALTAEHVRMLRRYVDQVILVFDSDEAGRRAADQALEIFLAELVDVRLAHVPEGKDPADFLLFAGADAFRRVLTSGVPALEFKWNQVLRQNRSGAAAPDRRRAVEAFLGLVARSAEWGVFEPIQRGLILNQVAQLLGISAEDAHRQMRIIARRAVRTPRQRGALERSEAVVAAATGDGSDAGMRCLLGVLLNAPQYFERVAGVFDPALVADVELREVADGVADVVKSGGALTLTALMDRTESVTTSSRIMALQIEGEKRGRYEENVEESLRCLKASQALRRLRDLTAAARGGDEAAPSEAPSEARSVEAAEVSAIRALHQTARGVRHFVPPKHLAAAAAESVTPPPVTTEAL